LELSDDEEDDDDEDGEEDNDDDDDDDDDDEDDDEDDDDDDDEDGEDEDGVDGDDADSAASAVAASKAVVRWAFLHALLQNGSSLFPRSCSICDEGKGGMRRQSVVKRNEQEEEGEARNVTQVLTHTRDTREKR
jgi:hypothetical protein